MEQQMLLQPLLHDCENCFSAVEPADLRRQEYRSEMLHQISSLSNLISPMSSGLIQYAIYLSIVVFVFPLIQNNLEEIHELLAFCLGSNHKQWRIQYVGTSNASIDRHSIKCRFVLWSVQFLICSLPGFSFQIINLNCGLINVAYRMLIYK